MKKLLKSTALVIAMMMAVTLIPIQSQAVAASKPANKVKTGLNTVKIDYINFWPKVK